MTSENVEQESPPMTLVSLLGRACKRPMREQWIVKLPVLADLPKQETIV